MSQFLSSIINYVEEEIESSGVSNNPQESEGEGSVCDTATCTPAEPGEVFEPGPWGFGEGGVIWPSNGRATDCP